MQTIPFDNPATELPASATDGQGTVFDETSGLWVPADVILEGDARLSDARTPTAHTHAESDVTGLTAALAAKQDAATAATDSELTAGLATKAAASHTHAQADVTSLVSDLAGKQPLDSDLTAIAALSTTSFGRSLLALADAAAGRAALGAAAATHSHAQSDITNLVSDLSGKQPLDSDLTAIAALTTTAFGRSLLESADAAASRALIGLSQEDWQDCTPRTGSGVTWAHYNTGNQKLRARRNALTGKVELKGWLTSTAGAYTYNSAASIMFDLPAGFPTFNPRIVHLHKYDGTYHSIVRVDFTGSYAQIKNFIAGGGDGGTTNYITFDGVSLDA